MNSYKQAQTKHTPHWDYIKWSPIGKFSSIDRDPTSHVWLESILQWLYSPRLHFIRKRLTYVCTSPVILLC